jgi:hypothetical protein
MLTNMATWKEKNYERSLVKTVIPEAESDILLI